MDKETQRTLCRRVGNNIANLNADLSSMHTQNRTLLQEIRDNERRVEEARRQVRDLMVPTVPGMGRLRSRIGKIVEDHGDLIQEINRVNRLSDAQSVLAAEIRNLDMLKSKIPQIERRIEELRRLVEVSNAGFARMRCSDVVGAGEIWR